MKESELLKLSKEALVETVLNQQRIINYMLDNNKSDSNGINNGTYPDGQPFWEVVPYWQPFYDISSTPIDNGPISEC